MSKSSISRAVRIRHSDSGKLDVVKGAMSGRLFLNESFVRNFETVRSLGTQVTLPYFPGSEAEILFPNPKIAGAVPFEQGIDGPRLKVIEWAIPKVRIFPIIYADLRINSGEIKGHTFGEWSSPRYWQRREEASLLAIQQKPNRFRGYHHCLR